MTNYMYSRVRIQAINNEMAKGVCVAMGMFFPREIHISLHYHDIATHTPATLNPPCCAYNVVKPLRDRVDTLHTLLFHRKSLV